MEAAEFLSDQGETGAGGNPAEGGSRSCPPAARGHRAQLAGDSAERQTQRGEPGEGRKWESSRHSNPHCGGAAIGLSHDPEQPDSVGAHVVECDSCQELLLRRRVCGGVRLHGEGADDELYACRPGPGRIGSRKDERVLGVEFERTVQRVDSLRFYSVERDDAVGGRLGLGRSDPEQRCDADERER